jgi:membrane protease YdiL (CAAX protease family)
LFVSFGHFIFSSAYSLLGVTASADSGQHQARFLGSLISEAGSLAVLWYVLSGQGRSWKDIGWNFKWMDVPRAAFLVLTSRVARYLALIPFQIFYKFYFGHYLAQRSMHGVLGFGISGLSIAFVCLNPFFEELIVRGYLMSEILELGGGGVLAILTSIAVQMSYHLYQGLGNGIALTAGFAVYSIYFLKTRRIAPVVFAHFYADAYALVRGSF